jgi:hypothetical protein
MNGDLTAASKFLSYVLRHNPAAIGAELDENGWITIETLLAAAASHGHPIGPGVLRQILNAPGKRRFETRGTQIRAAHGHSVPVDLQLTASEPPPWLYHGTVARFLPGIRAEGLKPGNRTPRAPVRRPRHRHPDCSPPRPPRHPHRRRSRRIPARPPVLPRSQRHLAHQPPAAAMDHHTARQQPVTRPRSWSWCLSGQSCRQADGLTAA